MSGNGTEKLHRYHVAGERVGCDMVLKFNACLKQHNITVYVILYGRNSQPRLVTSQLKKKNE